MFQTTSRVNWEQYFMNIDQEASTRATCDRKHVGAVITRDKTILSTGYNVSIRVLPQCDEAGHEMEIGQRIRTIHAEVNVIVQAARNGVNIDCGEIFVTARPCYNCFKMIANAGIRKIIFEEFYRDERIKKHADELGIELVHLEQ